MQGVVRVTVWSPCLAASTTSAAQHKVFEDLLWVGILILVIVLGAGIFAWLRRRMRMSRWAEPTGFTLEQLHRMRDRAAVTRAEYEALRGQALEGQRGTPELKG